ncbi:MAG: GLUG motif-containing protein [Sedimentisphaerales bacterium]|jgi:hypothetical protein|nr:GLUG motif-containing protein [Sedimentisphaerales bacterium]HNY76642.1 GLUG motif-containing protein [Sedimentisphaerales bacterium]HOC61751.1 GLUG motif-containing protein [Sedimentisphaerales bacterium]HOH62583.1 GLUG motif-containing protein [Sedimentisphaerales bacterium]HQA88434.1 GLUG motif-containing protein [Sedimentisphaerales bacterium]
MISVLFLWCALAASGKDYSGGTGEPNDPYLIATPQDLINLGQNPDHYDKHFRLTSEIDLSAYTFDRAVIAPDNRRPGWIDPHGPSFAGAFDGNDHVVRHLRIEGEDYLGLFGSLAPRAVVRNVRIEDYSIQGEDCIGSLTARNYGAVSDCYSSGVIAANYTVGSLVGNNDGGRMLNCHSVGEISAKWGCVGGLAGVNSGIVLDCHSEVTITSPGGFDLGGLIGSNSGVVSKCHSNGPITAGVLRLGGLIGVNYSGPVSNCYSTGTVTGYDEIGGLIGASSDGFVQGCYCTGAVAGYNKVGGLIGANRSNVSNCHSSGEVTGQIDIGGLIGVNYEGDVASCFWNADASGQSSSPAGVGLKTAEMQEAHVYLEAGWDFAGESSNGTAETWQIPPAGGYPRLAVHDGYEPVPLQGDGTTTDPFLIATAQDLGVVQHRPLACYRLTADLHLSGITWNVAPIPWFDGCFDGNGHVIHHLRIEGTGLLALFGMLNAGSVIRNLGLENASVTGTGDDIGLLAAHSAGLVANCYSKGNVAGSNSVGGLIGYGCGYTLNCYGLGTIAGNRYVGGLMGANYGGVSNCYSTAEVTEASSADRRGPGPGGLIGHNCSSVVHSFWDAEVSGITSGIYGTGLKTADMKEMATYLDAGWDFVDESANGTTDVWQMPPSGGYPMLSVFQDYEPVMPRGEGTPSKPFLITNAHELGAVAHRPAAWCRLEADIDLASISWGAAIVPWFAGRFDGDSHTISNLNVQGTGLLGLFGSLDTGAVIVNLDLEGGSIHGTDHYLGALAGRNDGILMGCHSSVAVSGEDRAVGGLVGWNGRGSISDSRSTGAVMGNLWIGGFVGFNAGFVSDCSSDATVNGDDSAGGLVGYNEGTVFRCSSSGPITGGTRIGGLVGANSGDVSSSRSAGATTGHNKEVGGLVGDNADGSVRNCYSSGTVGGSGAVGGLVGNNNYGSVQYCYSSGAVTGDYALGGLIGDGDTGRAERSLWDTQSSGIAHSAGGAGLTTAEMMDPEWVSLQGWTGNPNWVVNPHQDYPRLAWEEALGQPIPEPIIDWITGEGTSESPYQVEDVSQLLMVTKANLLWEKALVLTNDLDLGQTVWHQAVIPGFSGILDGHGHTIRNLTISGDSLLGLVGCLDNGGMIVNLGVADVNIVATGERIGGLIGYNVGGMVSHCQSTGYVSGDRSIGGLMGYNDRGSISDCNSGCRVIGDSSVGGLLGGNHGHVANCQTAGESHADGYGSVGGLIGDNYSRVSNCCSLGEVTAGRWANAGGLIGSNSGTVSACHSSATIHGGNTTGGLVGGSEYYSASISDCYSTGAVIAPDGWFVGGLIGQNQDGAVSNCYSTGVVVATNAWHFGGLMGSAGADTVEHSFWDIQTSGQMVSAAGTGLTTSEMWDIDTFLEAGWDFVGETDNGVEDLWWIDDGKDYPHLWWERGETE